MTWSNYLFSFQGRINRAKLWLFVLILIAVEIVYIALASMIFGMTIFTAFMAGGGHPGAALAGGTSALIFALVSFALFVVVIIAGLALTVKRLHDRNKGAVWLLVFWLLPLVLNVVGLGYNPGEGAHGALSAACALVALGI